MTKLAVSCVAILDPNLASRLVDLAWLRAPASEASLRDPGEAIALAQHRMALVGEDHPIVLHTLAAAYASEGRFDQAVETACQAVDHARATPGSSRAAPIEQRVAG